MDNVKEKNANIPLRQAGAILVIVSKDELKSLSHQQVSNRYGSDGLTPRKLHEINRRDENLKLQCIALRKMRFDYVMDYFSKNGTYPSAEMIEEITINSISKKDGSNENSTSAENGHIPNYSI